MTLEHAITLFNTEEFYACHDILEDLWREEPGEIRGLYQGLLQIGVSFHHYKKGNISGATTLLRKGMRRIADFAPSACGIDIRTLHTECAQAALHLDSGEELVDFPKIKKIQRG